MKVLWAALVIAVFGCIAVPVALVGWTVLCIIVWAKAPREGTRPTGREVVA